MRSRKDGATYEALYRSCANLPRMLAPETGTVMGRAASAVPAKPIMVTRAAITDTLDRLKPYQINLSTATGHDTSLTQDAGIPWAP